MSSWRAVFSTNEYINIFDVVQSSDWLFPDTEAEGWCVLLFKDGPTEVGDRIEDLGAINGRV